MSMSKRPYRVGRAEGPDDVLHRPCSYDDRKIRIEKNAHIFRRSNMRFAIPSCCERKVGSLVLERVL
jgi:hypothetical protein